MDALNQLRRNAYKNNYQLTKGYQHYLYNGALVKDNQGNKIPGYMLKDLRTGCYVYGGYDNNFDYLWSIDDVTSFLAELG